MSKTKNKLIGLKDWLLSRNKFIDWDTYKRKIDSMSDIGFLNDTMQQNVKNMDAPGVAQ